MKILKTLLIKALVWAALTIAFVVIDTKLSLSESHEWFPFVGIFLPIFGAIFIPFSKKKKLFQTKNVIDIPLDKSKIDSEAKKEEIDRVIEKIESISEDVKKHSEEIGTFPHALESDELEKVYYRTPGKPKCPRCGSEDIEDNYSSYKDPNEVYNKYKGTPVICKKCKHKWALVSIQNSVEIPLKESDRESMALDLLIECKTYASLATQAERISKFFECWDILMFKLEQLSAFEGLVDFKGELPSDNMKRLISEFHDKLQFAIDRHKKKVMSRFKEDLDCGTEEFKKFCQDVETNIKRFSVENMLFVQEASDEIKATILEQQRLASGNLVISSMNDELHNEHMRSSISHTTDTLTEVESKRKPIKVTEKMHIVAQEIFKTEQTSMFSIQRQLKLSYAETKEIMDSLESVGIVGPFSGSSPREILISKSEYEQNYQIIEDKPQKELTLSDVDYEQILKDEAEWRKEQMEQPPINQPVDNLFVSAMNIVLETDKASVPILQERLNISKSRAKELIDQMEKKGYISPSDCAMPRRPIISAGKWAEIVEHWPDNQ